MSTIALNYPEELKYVKTHEYMRLEDDFTVIIGITAFAADQLGDVTYVELPALNAVFQKDKPFGVIESVKSVSDLYMPVAGTIIAVNDQLASEPELVNIDCYGQGWMLKVRIANKDDLKDAMTAAQYRQFVVD